MFRLYLNDNLFYDDQAAEEELTLTSAKVNLAAGEAGTLEFAVPPVNTAYDTFAKLTSYVDLYRNSDLIFSGRVLDEYKDFNGISKVTCEGLLAVFNDSYFAPTTYSSITVSELVQTLLASHNAQVGTDKQVSLGNITIDEASDNIYRAYEDYKLTIERLKDLVDSFGGYMSVRKTWDTTEQAWKRYLDWVPGFTSYASQEINFGENLIDLTQDSSAAEIITVLIPLGAEVENEDGTRKRLTVGSVNNESVTIEDADAIAEFGRVVGIHVWDDVTVASNLLAKGRAYLNDMKRSRVTINAKAVDMARAGSSVVAFKVGERVKVSAPLFGVDAYFVVMSQSLDLMNPAQNQMSLGDKVVGYVGKTNAQQAAVNDTVNRINGDYTQISQLHAVESAMVNMIGEYSTRFEELDDKIQSVVDFTESEEGSDSWLKKLETRVTQTEQDLSIEVEARENIEGVITQVTETFDFTEDGLRIGRSDSDIHSVQDHDSYEFRDSAENRIFSIDTSGTTAKQANVTGQIGIGAGSVEEYTEQWAIRKGTETNGKYDLEIVWVGGN